MWRIWHGVWEAGYSPTQPEVRLLPVSESLRSPPLCIRQEVVGKELLAAALVAVKGKLEYCLVRAPLGHQVGL